jgi:DNA replication protein DnaC
MLHHPTHDKLTRLKLFGMARAFAEQSALNLDHLGFEERLGLLVDHEVTERDGKALALRLQRAKLKPNTAAEDTDYRHARGLDKAMFQRLLAGQWLADKQNVLLTGPTGVGKTWLACALAHQACRQGYSAYYVRLPRLLDELGIGRTDGRYGKLLKQLARIDTLVIDLCVAPIYVESRQLAQACGPPRPRLPASATPHKFVTVASAIRPRRSPRGHRLRQAATAHQGRLGPGLGA